MARALKLARRGEALASPNPLVGAVLVKRGRVVGEAFHTYAGVKHAEVLALEKAGKAARGATLYINLEPCCHTGRTGPCTDALVAAGVRRVVAAMRDPNPRVAGRGFVRLRRAGIRVDVGLCEAEAQRLNEAFAKWIRTGLPFVTLKSAMTLDAKIAAPPSYRRLPAGLASKRQQPRGSSITWITSPPSRAEVQRMRHAHDALVTGIGTILADDPRLTDRSGRRRRRPLLRVILDSRLRLPLRSQIVRSARHDVLVFTAASADSPRARRLREAGIEVEHVRSMRGRLDLHSVLWELGRRNITSVLIEPGAALAHGAAGAGVLDKVVLFIAPRIMGAGVAIDPTVLLSGPRPRTRRGGFTPPAFREATGALIPVAVRRCGPDLIMEGYLRNV
jgi:diaminohydroxyphosphoribosylaminopyrimidine deaminase/5-amino-6-(5-phosphoribosylamino)uracil reductase